MANLNVSFLASFINQSFPSLNNIDPSWADIQVTFTAAGGPGLQMGDIKAIKWSRSVEVGKKRGASGGRVVSRTTGQGDQEASMTLYRAGYRNLLKTLVAQAPIRGTQSAISLVSFDILIQHTPPGEVEIYQTAIKGCRFLKDTDDMKEGTDPDTIDIDLNPIEIANLIDGQEVVLL